jgi:hypothetical protein
MTGKKKPPQYTTAPLFDDEPVRALTLSEAVAQARPATKAQQNFQRLVTQLERRREQLKRWQDYGLRYNERLAKEVMPLRAEYEAAQRQMALLIDELLTTPVRGLTLGRRQRAKLRQLLIALVTGLLEGGAGDDKVLVALHDKHGDMSHAERQQTEMALTEALLKDVFGMDVEGDHGAKTAEELIDLAHRKAHERALEAERQRQERQAARAARRKSPAGLTPAQAAAQAKAAAAQDRRDQVAREVSQSLRDIYRKLASALHPDRETDTAERERKTLLMQRVNQAYEANDLLSLLGLQLEIEQIDAEHLAGVPAERLAHYTQILRQQLKELETELSHCVLPFREILGWDWRPSVVPATVDQHLSGAVAELRDDLEAIRQDLVHFKDPKRLREMLKHLPLDEQDESDEDPDFDALMDVLGAMPMPTPDGTNGPKRRAGKRGRR